MAWLAAGQELLSAGFCSFKGCCIGLIAQAGFNLHIKTSKFRQQYVVCCLHVLGESKLPLQPVEIEFSMCLPKHRCLVPSTVS